MWTRPRPWLWVSKEKRSFRLHCDVCHGDFDPALVVGSRFRGKFSKILNAHRRCGCIEE